MRFVVEKIDGDIADVTNMFNGMGMEILDPAEAESIVVRVASDCWVSASANDYEIHTVH